MTLIELMKECCGLNTTTFQQIAKCKSFIGSEIEMTYTIHDIVDTMIFLNFGDYGPEKIYYFSFHITYDNKKFGDQLLGYSKGDLVTVKAKLKKVEYSAPNQIYFDMLSIN